MSDFRATTRIETVAAEGCGVRARVCVQNTGPRLWPARGPISVSCLIFDDATGVQAGEGPRAPLCADVEPGGRTVVDLLAPLPEDDGLYLVVVSLVEDPVAWFHERGADAIEIQARVSGERATVLGARAVGRGGRAAARFYRAIRNVLVLPVASIVRHRGLIRSMVRRDVQGRYRGSLGGSLWTVVQPLLLMLAYFFVFSVVLRVRFGPGPESSLPVNFLLYFICGMLPWLAFSEALARAPSVMLEHRTLVTRVLFPVEILPVNVAASGLVTGFFALVVFIAMLLGFRHGIPVTALYVPLLIVPQVLLTAGLCWFLAALGVFLRDIGQFMNFVLTVWFFATPICYPESAVPARFAWLLAKNPMYVMARGYRAVFLEHSAPEWAPLAWMTLAGLAAFFAGYAWFHKSRRSFADIL